MRKLWKRSVLINRINIQELQDITPQIAKTARPTTQDGINSSQVGIPQGEVIKHVHLRQNGVNLHNSEI